MFVDRKRPSGLDRIRLAFWQFASHRHPLPREAVEPLHGVHGGVRQGEWPEAPRVLAQRRHDQRGRVLGRMHTPTDGGRDHANGL